MRYLPLEKLEATLEGIQNARIALIGDFCLDVYWLADMKLSELSRETPHHPLPVVSERYSPGGAGNVAANVAALKPAQLTALGALGRDWRGELLKKTLGEAGVNCARFVQSDALVTNAYIKPLRAGISQVVYEDARIDFENRAPMSEALNAVICETLKATVEDFDVLLVSDQMQYGCILPELRKTISQLGQSGKRVIVDSRNHIADYHHVIVKPNEVEASRAYADGHALTLDEMRVLALQISERNAAPAIITAGEQGCFVAEGGQVAHIPARAVEPPIDIVGAGDTFLAALGCALGGGSSLCDAARFASLASSVTIQKLGTTGTASDNELRKANIIEERG